MYNVPSFATVTESGSPELDVAETSQWPSGRMARPASSASGSHANSIVPWTDPASRNVSVASAEANRSSRPPGQLRVPGTGTV
jgi:hypothetical protein